MNIPHFGHLSGRFQARIRCNGETGQAGLNFSRGRAPRGGSRFNTAANRGAVLLLPSATGVAVALNSVTAS